MSALDEIITELGRLAMRLPSFRALPDDAQRPTRHMVLKLVNGSSPPSVPLPELRLHVVLREVRSAHNSNRPLAQLPPRTLRDAIWLLWHPSAKGTEIPGLLSAILDRAAVSTTSLRRLIDVWLIEFALDKPRIPEVGRRIAAALQQHREGRLSGWRLAHDEIDLFDAGSGPAKLAARILQRGSAETLKAYRFDDAMRGSGGYMLAVHDAFGRQLGQPLKGVAGNAAFSEAQEFYAPRGRLHFDMPRPRGSMADALIAPWLDRAPPPVALDRKAVLKFLREQLGDPRVEPERWSEAKSETRQAVRSWLSAISLDAFFDLIGRFANQAGLDRHWQSRRAFWNACLRKDFIDDSWLLLGDAVRRDSRIRQELAAAHGDLVGSDPNHSVLLMRVGGLVFAEFSHMGKVRAWPREWPSVPPLFKTGENHVGALRVRCMEFPAPRDRPDLTSTGSDGLTHHEGVWQGRVAELIRRRTGRVLENHEWAVR